MLKCCLLRENISFVFTQSVDLVLMLCAAPQMCWFRTVNSSLTLLDLSEVFACWNIKPASYVPSSDHSAFWFIFFFHSLEEKLKGTILKVRKEQCCKLFSDRSIIFSHIMTVRQRSSAFPLPVSCFSYFSHHLCMAESDFTNYCHISSPLNINEMNGKKQDCLCNWEEEWNVEKKKIFQNYPLGRVLYQGCQLLSSARSENLGGTIRFMSSILMIQYWFIWVYTWIYSAC